MEYISNVLIKPHSIAVFNHHCCVSDESLNGFVWFDLCSNLIIGRVVSFPEGAGIAELSNPKGITFDAKKFLYIPDSGNDRISIMDEQLSIKLVFSGTFPSPQDVKIMNEITYVLASNPWSCIHVFTLNGTPIRTIISSKQDFSLQLSSAFQDICSFLTEVQTELVCSHLMVSRFVKLETIFFR